jgi:spore germination cell wall hydrolase CwlJ-like protein
MYFESNRSSRDGLMAVGTVVMNRVASPLYPNTICGVVVQPALAAGVLTRSLNERELPPVERAADAILAGERYKPMHFHVAGLNIPYRVQYVEWRAATRSTSRLDAGISPCFAIHPLPTESCWRARANLKKQRLPMQRRSQA